MKYVCSYCRVVYKETPEPTPAGIPADAVSHGICPKCFKKIDAEMDAAGYPKLDEEKTNNEKK